MYTAGASRALSEYYELKMGSTYSLIAGYMIEDEGEILAQMGTPGIFELILAESQAMAGLATAGLALVLSFGF